MAFVGARLFRSASANIRCVFQPKCIPKNIQVNALVARGMAGGGTQKMFIKASRFTDLRFLRAFRHYALLTGIPIAVGVTLINVFVGQAEYAEIPEGYEPKHWEYHRHPITRWLARNFLVSPQQDYEKMAHYMEIEGEKMKARKEEREVKRLMRASGDGHYYYYPIATPPKWKAEEEMKE